METQKQESAPGRIWMQQLVPLMHTPFGYAAQTAT